MIRFIINIYLATTIASLIAFVLNFRRLDKYYRKQGLQAVFNKDSLVCLLMCFIPIVHYLQLILNMENYIEMDEDFEEYFKEENNE